MDEIHTTAAVQRYLDELGEVRGESRAAPIVRDLLARSVDRLHLLCSRLLYRSYPRLTRGPLNLCPEELLGAVVERMIKAMRDVRPANVRQFFALANQHMRWELNDLARRLDAATCTVQLYDSRVPAAAAAEPRSAATDPQAAPSGGLARVLAAIEALPEEEREVFNLVRLQGMTQPEAARVVGVSAKTVQRRLNRSLVLLGECLGGPGLAQPAAPSAAAGARVFEGAYADGRESADHV